MIVPGILGFTEATKQEIRILPNSLSGGMDMTPTRTSRHLKKRKKMDVSVSVNENKNKNKPKNRKVNLAV